MARLGGSGEELLLLEGGLALDELRHGGRLHERLMEAHNVSQEGDDGAKVVTHARISLADHANGQTRSCRGRELMGGAGGGATPPTWEGVPVHHLAGQAKFQPE